MRDRRTWTVLLAGLAWISLSSGGALPMGATGSAADAVSAHAPWTPEVPGIETAFRALGTPLSRADLGRVARTVAAEARRAGFSSDFVLAVIQIESGGHLAQGRPRPDAAAARYRASRRRRGGPALGGTRDAVRPRRERPAGSGLSGTPSRALRESLDRAHGVQLGPHSGLGHAPPERADSRGLQPARSGGLPRARRRERASDLSRGRTGGPYKDPVAAPKKRK